VFWRRKGREMLGCGKGRGGHTRNAPTSPKILNKFAKCKYHPKFLAKWNGSSGRLWKRILLRIFEESVARATNRVIVLLRWVRFVVMFTEITSGYLEENKGKKRLD
jgi:hypothetical protein